MSCVLVLAIVTLNLCVPAHSAPKYRVLHSFNGTDGSGPYGGVTSGPDGGLYGTTGGGGPCGTVFELSRWKSGRWKETVLYQFDTGNDGCDPWSKVTLMVQGTSMVPRLEEGAAHTTPVRSSNSSEIPLAGRRRCFLPLTSTTESVPPRA